jgi:transposase
LEVYIISITYRPASILDVWRYMMKRRKKEGPFEILNRNAAGIDVGAESLYVAVPADRDERDVRRFGTFTRELYSVRDWLLKCKITDVVMESTGIYWQVLFDILEKAGMKVFVVNARNAKNMPGRKTDVKDCQWLQQLHTFGLLTNSFIPGNDIRALRTYYRQRDILIKKSSESIQHMQKALIQMNVLLNTVLSDITSKTGMLIINSILAGERDAKRLAAFRDPNCKKTESQIELALEGNFEEEHLFSLKQALDTYRHYQNQIDACEKKIETHLGTFEQCRDKQINPPVKKKLKKESVSFNLKEYAKHIFGIDLMAIPGIGGNTVLSVLSEAGCNLKDNWNSEKRFTSWLCICPNNKITGGRVISSRTMRSNNRLATALRLAAQTVRRSDNIIGEYYRRMRGRIGPQKAVTATAHKLARIIYRLVVNQEEYDPEKIRQSEAKTKIHKISYHMKQLKKLGVDKSYFMQAAS